MEILALYELNVRECYYPVTGFSKQAVAQRVAASRTIKFFYQQIYPVNLTPNPAG